MVVQRLLKKADWALRRYDATGNPEFLKIREAYLRQAKRFQKGDIRYY